jgi:DNA (cytosine-5)-methyltransferase 1
MLRIIGEIKPSWVVAENVEGLISMAQSNWKPVMEDETVVCEEAEMVLETIRKDLEKAGYQSVPIIAPAAAVGASHRRYRIFIVACSEIIRCNVSGKITTSKQGSKTIIADARRTRESGEILADPAGKRCGEARERIGRPQEWAAGRSEIVAHASGAGRQELDAAAEPIRPGHHSGGGDAEPLADADGKSGLEAYSPARSFGGKRESRNNVGRGGRSSRAAECGGPTQPGMGGNAHELSNWLDGRGVNPLDALAEFIAQYPQPALWGQPQHDWEPPRVLTGIKNRAARLKALGNAVDPLQVLPVLYGIRIIHDFLVNGGKLK